MNRSLTLQTSLLTKLHHLALPVSCAGCGQWDTPLCEQCAAQLLASPFPVHDAPALAQIPAWALNDHTGPARRLVVAWKTGRREDLQDFMLQAGQQAGLTWARTWSANQSVPLLVVPAPSGIKRRLTGHLVAADLADAIACGIGNSQLFPAVASADVLRRHWFSGTAHQTGQSARQRQRNRAIPPAVLTDLRGMNVLLTDDVLTTGATLQACTKAIERSGGQVVGALVLTAAPPPSKPKLPILRPGVKKGLTGKNTAHKTTK